MPFNDEKKININDFFGRLHLRIKTGGSYNALIFFQVFLEHSIVKELGKQEGVPPDWHILRLNAGDFDKVYPFAAEMLFEAAARNFSEHWNSYQDAHTVSIAFCEELNEFFECSGEETFELIPIKSYVEIAIESGTVTVEDGMVKLTPEAEEVVRNIKREIKES